MEFQGLLVRVMDIQKDEMINQAGVSAAAFLAPDMLQELSSSSTESPKKDGSSFIKKFGGGL